MNKIINKQVLATFALVTIMAGVLIGTNCIYAAQDGKETTTIRLINQTYFNAKNIEVTWNDGKEQTVNTLGSHDSIDFLFLVPTQVMHTKRNVTTLLYTRLPSW